MNNLTTEKYRFELGKLYEFSEENNDYVFVYMNARNNTEKKAILAYERDMADPNPY